MAYITTAATLTLPKVYGIHLEINKATTGTITIADAGTTVGVVAASTAAGGKDYWGLNGVVTVVNSATEDITVSVINTPR